MEDVWSGGVKLGLLAEVFTFLLGPAPAAALEQEEESDERADQDHDDDGQEPGLVANLTEYLRFLKCMTR